MPRRLVDVNFGLIGLLKRKSQEKKSNSFARSLLRERKPLTTSNINMFWISHDALKGFSRPESWFTTAKFIERTNSWSQCQFNLANFDLIQQILISISMFCERLGLFIYIYMISKIFSALWQTFASK